MQKHVFSHSRHSKISILKVFGGLEVCENASKHVLTTLHQNTCLTTPDVQNHLFLKKRFWWILKLRKCIKTRF
jgi:hypothetical protein